MDQLRNIIGRRNFYTCTVILSKDIPTTLKGRKPSSQRWLTRQLQDPYVEKAKQEHYRCRSAFKLLEINERFNILTPGLIVVDCGAAPGSWTQVVVKLTNSIGKQEGKPIGSVFAIDRLPIHPIEGANILGNVDFTTTVAQDKLRELLNGKLVDVVLTDMAPNATGVRSIDHDQIIDLAYSALQFALKISVVDGTFVAKLWDGGKSPQFEKDVGRFYKTLKIVRPAATRDESTEKFILARGFKGLK